MREIIRACPECHEDAAVHLGDVEGFSLYACVRCDAEFQLVRESSDPDEAEAD
ncbi:hypothetical protein [Aeromicrobium sp. Leaf350]|uniref:hypothetical protein n=1 Tax=Aeromicrobium sp. Leaf350 TaxID=2876565 RepID=UPI001E41CF75|nr:hypothetical protein [Aeromicrobium sp. Leaf350]